MSKEWHVCPQCKQSRRHDLVYIHSVGGRVVEEEYKCTECGHKILVTYKRKEKK